MRSGSGRGAPALGSCRWRGAPQGRCICHCRRRGLLLRSEGQQRAAHGEECIGVDAQPAGSPLHKRIHHLQGSTAGAAWAGGHLKIWQP